MHTMASKTRLGKLAGILAVLITLALTTGAFAEPVQAADGDNTAKKYTFKSNLEEWHAKNNDIQGWLYVGGTNINYPVIFYPEDTFYYNSLDYNKEYSVDGVIWADALTRGGTESEMSKNTVLYGHNWTNWSTTPAIGRSSDVMFSQLTAYHYLDFAREHQFINYANADGAYVYQIFAVFYTEKSFMYNRSNPTRVQLDEMLDGAIARSIHDFNIEVSTSDKFITLSTCTRMFGKSKDQRFVVMAKQVPAGTEPVTVKDNPNYQRPKL